MTEDRDDTAWRLNYFNYFTEVEEQFQRARGTGLFLLSPLDWALIEAWKSSGIPLAAVIRGIDAAFEKWRSRKSKTQMVNSLAFCAQAVLKEAEAMAKNPASAEGHPSEEPPFSVEAVRRHLVAAAEKLRNQTGFESISANVDDLVTNIDTMLSDPQDLDLRLTALEDKMAAIARTRISDEQLLSMRRDLESQLSPYRSKMSGEQLARLEKSFLDRKVYDSLGLPRLSLFFMI